MPKSKVSDLLKANKATAKPSKSKVPTIQVSKDHDALHDAYVAMEQAKGVYETLHSNFMAKADAVYEENAKAGNFSKSYNFPGVHTPGVQVIYKDSFYAVDEKNEEMLRALMGDEYDHCFEESRKLSLKDTSDETIDLLIKKLGRDQFLGLFDIKLTIAPKKDMDRKQFDLSDEARKFVKQYKASVKLAK